MSQPGDSPSTPPRRAAWEPGTPADTTTRLAQPATGADADYAPTRAAVHHHLFTRSLAWTSVGALLPGVGLWPTKYRRLGLGVAGVALVAVIGTALKAKLDLGGMAALAFEPNWLLTIAIGCAVLALAWVVLIAGTHLVTRPKALTRNQRTVGALAVAGLSFLVSAPLAVATTYALAQRDLVTSVFKNDTRSGTRPGDIGTGSNPWANKPRLNILLLGGDNSIARDKIDPNEGIRTDSIILASIDTTNGNTVLIQLPRNTERFPFPADSELAKAYPNGYWDGITGENPEFELNSVWDNVPRDHPELFKNTDYPHGDAIKLAVQGITGLSVDYFLLLSIDGLQKMIDAMGGITVNINERIPIAQTTEQAAAGIAPKGGYLEPGANKHLTGYQAMWYARSRSQSTDYARMGRQSCVINAVIDQANPQTMLTHYESMADAGKNMVITDIPGNVLPAVVSLALTVKGGAKHRLLFANGVNGFHPWKPDVTAMAAQVQQAIDASEGKLPAASTTTGTTTATTTASKTASASASKKATNSTSPSASASTPVTTNLSDDCAYHPGS